VLVIQKFLKSQLLVASGYMAMNLGNYLTAIIAGRVLPSLTFSAYIGLSSLISIFTTITGMSQNVISHQVSRDMKLNPIEASQSINIVSSKISSVLILVSVIWMLSVPFINQSFGGGLLLPLAFSTFIVWLATLLPALVGVANGLLRFGSVSLAFLVGGLSRPLIFLIIIQFSDSLLAPIISLNLSLLLTCSMVFFLMPNRSSIRRHAFSPRLFSISIERIATVLMILSGAILSYSDTIISRLNLSESDSASFAASAILTNITLYGGLIIIAVLIPTIAKHFDESNERILLARWSIALVTIFGCFYSVALYFYGEIILSFSLGSKFEVGGTFIAFYNMAFTVVALVVLTVNFAISTVVKISISVSFALTSVAYVIGVFYFGSSMYRIVLGTGLASIVLLVISLGVHDSIFRTALRPLNSHR
jgi:O-antigen/teichoic acid export membrane protein